MTTKTFKRTLAKEAGRLLCGQWPTCAHCTPACHECSKGFTDFDVVMTIQCMDTYLVFCMPCAREFARHAALQDGNVPDSITVDEHVDVTDLFLDAIKTIPKETIDEKTLDKVLTKLTESK